MLFGVPKPDGSTRPILNLSDKKHVGYSINDKLDPSLCTVEYCQTKQVVETVQALGKNAWLWARDLKDGYYNVSINESDINKLGFMFEGRIYIFQRLPMGLSSSPKIFTDFMKFPIWAIKSDRPDLYYVQIDLRSIDPDNFMKDADFYILEDTAILAVLFYYLDDILGGHTIESMAWKQFHHTETILRRLSLRTKEAKSKPPSQIQKWLGKLYDTRRQWLSLPKEKSDKYKADIESAMRKSSITVRDLLRHIGRTRHMASIYRPLAAFARNLEQWVYPYKHLDHHLHISKPLREDMKLCVWGITRAAEYGISFQQFLRPMNIPDITIYTDAALNIGLGGISDEGDYFVNNWTDVNLHHATNRDIVWKELVAIYVFVASLASKLSHKTVHIYTDNEACKYMLINMRCNLQRPDLQCIINEFCKLCIEQAIVPWIEHIAGKDNVIPDALSRNKPIAPEIFKKYNNRVNTTMHLQYASDLCKNIIIKNKSLLEMKDI